MAFTKRIVCLANSYKNRGLCIAGREVTPSGYGPWIRPISARPKQELYLVECHCPGVGVPNLLDIVDITFHSAAPNHHQIENHLIDPHGTWIKRGELPFAELEHIRQQPPTLWINTGRTAHGINDCIARAEALTQKNSLILIKVRSLIVEVRVGHYTQRKQFRCKFRHAGTDYNLSLTDHLTRDRFERNPPGEYSIVGNPALYLTLSLTEPFTEDDRCHKLVAAILRNPSSVGHA